MHNILENSKFIIFVGIMWNIVFREFLSEKNSLFSKT